MKITFLKVFLLIALLGALGVITGMILGSIEVFGISMFFFLGGLGSAHLEFVTQEDLRRSGRNRR